MIGQFTAVLVTKTNVGPRNAVLSCTLDVDCCDSTVSADKLFAMSTLSEYMDGYRDFQQALASVPQLLWEYRKQMASNDKVKDTLKTQHHPKQKGLEPDVSSAA